ncbi:hypothetical protein D3C75_850230 [compost metagenome]
MVKRSTSALLPRLVLMDARQNMERMQNLMLWPLTVPFSVSASDSVDAWRMVARIASMRAFDFSSFDSASSISTGRASPRRRWRIPASVDSP